MACTTGPVRNPSASVAAVHHHNCGTSSKDHEEVKVHETSHETAVHDAVLVAWMAARPAPAGCRNRALPSDKRSTMTSPSGSEGEVPKESVIDSIAGTSAEASRASVRSCSVTTVTFVPGVHALEGTLRKASWSFVLEARSKVTSTAP